MSEIIKQEDGTYHFKLYKPAELDKLHKISGKMKGSDGIERTLSEWWDHISAKAAYADGDESLDKELVHLQCELRNALTIGAGHIESFGNAAREYFKLALRDCMEKGASEDGAVERMKTKVESLSRSLGKTQWAKYGRGRLGIHLLFYIEEHHDLPRNRKELELFSKSVRDGGIKKETIRDHIDWYGLDKVCATHE